MEFTTEKDIAIETFTQNKGKLKISKQATAGKKFRCTIKRDSDKR